MGFGKMEDGCGVGWWETFREKDDVGVSKSFDSIRLAKPKVWDRE